MATVGSWPPPLVIPEEVDEMPNSDVPRGFICPITQVCLSRACCGDRAPKVLRGMDVFAPTRVASY